MKWYATVGIWQHSMSDEWVHVNDAVQARDGKDAFFKVAQIAFARAARENPGQTYPLHQTAAQFNAELDRTGDWHFWQIATVELSAGLPILYADTFADTDQLQGYLGTREGHLFVVAGQGGGGDGWVQKWRDSLSGVEKSMGDWWDHFYSGWDFEGVYGIVEEVQPGVLYRIYDGEHDLIQEIRTRGGRHGRIFGAFANPAKVKRRLMR